MATDVPRPGGSRLALSIMRTLSRDEVGAIFAPAPQRRFAALEILGAALRFVTAGNDQGDYMTLSSDVVESLRELTRGELQRPLPTQHAEVLIERGYAAAKDGKIVITQLGRALLAMQPAGGNA